MIDFSIAEFGWPELDSLGPGYKCHATHRLIAVVLGHIKLIALPVPSQELRGSVTVALVDQSTIRVRLFLRYTHHYTQTHGRNKKVPLKRPRQKTEDRDFHSESCFDLEVFPLTPHQSAYLRLPHSWGSDYRTNWAVSGDLQDLIKAPAGIFGGSFEIRVVPIA